MTRPTFIVHSCAAAGSGASKAIEAAAKAARKKTLRPVVTFPSLFGA
jgi:hypothetical protein